MKTPPFPRISQSDSNAEQCELFRTKNKRSQSMPVDGGSLTLIDLHIMAACGRAPSLFILFFGVMLYFSTFKHSLFAQVFHLN